MPRRIEVPEMTGGTAWRLALLLVLARTALISALLGQRLGAAGFTIATLMVVLDLLDLRRSRGTLQRA